MTYFEIKLPNNPKTKLPVNGCDMMLLSLTVFCVNRHPKNGN